MFTLIKLNLYIFDQMKRCFVFFVFLFLHPFILFSQQYEPTWIRTAVIQVENRALADTVAQRLRAGESFYFLASKFSSGPNVSGGGEGDWHRIDMVPQWMQDIFNKIKVDSVAFINLENPYLFFKKLNEGKESDYLRWEMLLARSDSLAAKAAEFNKRREFNKCIAATEEALKIRKQILGSDHPNFVRLMTDLAELYCEQSKYKNAEVLIERSLRIGQRHFGRDHPEVAEILDAFTLFYHSQGKYKEAEVHCLNALKIREKSMGPSHLDTIINLKNLAAIRFSQGKYLEADSLSRFSLKLAEESLKPNHPDYADFLEAHAMIKLALGDYSSTEALIQRALKIKEHNLKPDDPKIAHSLHNLAVYYFEQGQYGKAEAVCQRSLKIRERVFGVDHPDFAINLRLLGNLYIKQGKYEDAKTFFERALSITKRALGPDHPQCAEILNDFGYLSLLQEDYAFAEQMLKRALEIRESLLGADHRYVTMTLSNLAALYYFQDNYKLAEPLYQRILKIQEKVLVANHPDIAISLDNLAMSNHMQKNYATAKILCQRSLLIREQTLEPSHYSVATNLSNLGVIEMALGQRRLAIEHFERAANIEASLLQNLLVYLSDNEKLTFLNSAQSGRALDTFLTLVTDSSVKNITTIRAAFNFTLQRKAISHVFTSRQQQVNINSNDSVSVRLLQRLQTLSQQIASLTFSGPRSTAFKAYINTINKLSAEREQIEDSLTQHSETFLLERKAQKADISQVSTTLPKGSNLIEFVRYKKLNFKAAFQDQRWGTTNYAAFSLPAGRSKDLRIIDLGPAAPIDSLILACRAEMKENVAKLGSRPRKDAENYLASISHQLYQFLFAPVKAVLPDSGMLYCAPDGLLHILPFEILVDENGKYLVERYQFNYLGNGRDLLHFGKASTSREMYVFADANFDGKPVMEFAKKKPLLASDELALPSENVQRSRDWRGGKFTPLDSTVAEARAIQSLFKINERQMFLDLKATEEHLLSLKSPWRLHIATHGFFLKDMEAIRGLMFNNFVLSPLMQKLNPAGYQQATVVWENPLLRSGLALAYVNTIGQHQDSTQTYDGIATAYEISGMNLQDTDLVVLSACETGLGDVHIGEGVFGLRRAFQLAGAQTVVMSLWKVPDNDTKNLMIDFYTRLKNGEGKSQALRNASLAMMKKQKGQHGSAHPYFWGAFICAGNPE